MTTATKASESATKELRPLKDDTLTMAKTIAKELVIDKATGVVTITADTYAKLLPESVPEATIKAMQEHNTTFIAAATYALAEVAAPVMKKNGELTKAELSVPLIGKDVLELGYTRSEEVSDGKKDDQGNYGRKTNFGTTSARFKTYAAGNRGELAKVKEHVSAAAAALFS